MLRSFGWVLDPRRVDWIERIVEIVLRRAKRISVGVWWLSQEPGMEGSVSGAVLGLEVVFSLAGRGR
jgi:hypothetical protein